MIREHCAALLDRDLLAKRVADRLDRMATVTGFQQGATSAVYGAAVLRVRLGIGIEPDALKGYSTLYDKYRTFNARRVTGAEIGVRCTPPWPTATHTSSSSFS